MKKLLFLLITLFMCDFASFSQELPESWDQMYMNGGQFEYCSHTFNASGAEVTISLLKEEITVSLEGTAMGNNVLMNFGGIKVKGDPSDYSYTFRIPYGKELDEVLSKGSRMIRISFEGSNKSITAPFTGNALKDINQAIAWAKANSF